MECKYYLKDSYHFMRFSTIERMVGFDSKFHCFQQSQGLFWREWCGNTMRETGLVLRNLKRNIGYICR